ncbi:endonuclease [Photobacterium indicum]|uniref:Endonuclease n=1 Tax=Photobacterium indicum TaxID=81447 RepID=A0A2T3LEL8_9GAMM|nr:endonuclease [Photobacterium indicum]
MSQDNLLAIEQDAIPLILSDTIKIATFNLFNYLEPPFAFYDFERIYTAEQWQKKQNWIAEYLIEYKPDVIGFQEVFSPESLKILVAAQGYGYFEVVDEAEVIDDFICRSPVVAIASRYPITHIEAVVPDKELAVAMGLKDDFTFSRQPLRATIELPHIGECDCYVVHFKSKRPMIEHENNDNDESRTQTIIQTLKAEVTGSWGSSIQRGSEAALLLMSIIERREKTGLPMMLMGDFNDSLSDGVLAHLLTGSLRFISESESDVILAKYRLKDTWDLYQATDNCTEMAHRTPTHYYGVKKSVLDYILLSCEFDAQYHSSLFEVSEHDTYDRHLINPSFERDSQSTDHGIVCITLALRA